MKGVVGEVNMNYPQINEASLIRPGFNMSNKCWGMAGLGFVLNANDITCRALISDHQIRLWQDRARAALAHPGAQHLSAEYEDIANDWAVWRKKQENNK